MQTEKPQRGAKRQSTTKGKPRVGDPPGAKNKKPASLEAARVVAALRRLGSARVRTQMRDQFGIVTDKAFGVRMSAMQALGKRLVREHVDGRHELALALWKTGWYEARTVAAFVEEPGRVTPAQMDAWAKGFDNWGICDTVCFHLFDRTAHAFKKVDEWSRRREEFVKRAAFALLASLALHDKQAQDAHFTRRLPLVERAATDDRNFVKKGVSWALRSIGRRSAGLHAAAVEVAQRLAASPDASSRWVGKDALRDLLKPAVKKRVAAKGRPSRAAR